LYSKKYGYLAIIKQKTDASNFISATTGGCLYSIPSVQSTRVKPKGVWLRNKEKKCDASRQMKHVEERNVNGFMIDRKGMCVHCAIILL